MHIDVSLARRLRAASLLSFALAALAPPWVAAQTAPPSETPAVAPLAVPEPAAPAASAPTITPATPPEPAARLEPVEVRGTNNNDTQLRRASTAAKITIGRDEIERFGDSTVGDLLKRLPGVTLQGRPGRGGSVSMRGMGGGYTQILLDGERVSAGFSIESLSPEQIERIEIQRAPTAETGARAIAGTINIVTREGYTKQLNDLRLALGVENDALQPGLTWTRNDTLGGLPYNVSMTLFRSDRRNDSRTVIERRRLSTGALLLDQTEHNAEREKRHGVNASGRLQWRGEAGQTAMLMPIVVDSRGSTRRDATLSRAFADPIEHPAPAYDAAHSAGDGGFSLLRLNGVWAQRLGGEGQRLEWRGGAGRTRFYSSGTRQEVGGELPDRIDDEVDNTERSLSSSAKLTLLLGDGAHAVVTGAEIEANRRVEGRVVREDGGAPIDPEFGANLTARVRRLALYAQDEWSLSPNWAAHGGLRWEGITTSADGMLGEPEISNRSSVWSPLLHLLWKPDPAGRDQLRASLTRSYRSPSLGSLIARRRESPQNSATRPDRAGNPNLRPELATGLDLAIEHYLPASGLLSANLFQRRITDYMRSRTELEPDPNDTNLMRFVARTQNVGSALTRGLELEAKFRLSALVDAAPHIDLRANASAFRSSVEGVAGPDNRIDQQPDWTANLGADYRIPATRVTLGASVNLTPRYTTRLSAQESAETGRKIVGDAYVLWVVNPTLQVRLTASNVDPQVYTTGRVVDDPLPPAGGSDAREISRTDAPTYLNVQLRLEFKL
jgi:outer membrane receptor for ferrienterochelin and colicins